MLKRFLLFMLLFFPIFVGAEELALASNARSAILIEASTGKVLYERNADEALAPASMTKMMTLLLTMEAIDSGKIKLEDKVIVSENAASMGGSQVFLSANTEYKLEEIIKAVCIASGNDAAVVLAETIGGSVDNFVAMMNKKARDLGLTSTNFVNVYGLDAKGHLSSARDMAKIARELIKHELILKYSSIYEEYLNKPDGSSIWMVNTNKLVRFYKGIDGLKTGFTNKAGYCLTATGMWNGMRLISVVMNEETQENRSKDTIELMNYGKSNYRVKTVIKKGEVVGEIEIELGDKRSEKVVTTEDIVELVDYSSDKEEYNYTVDIRPINAPVKKGDIVGTITLKREGNVIATSNLTVKSDVKKVTFLKLLKRMLTLLILGFN